MTRVVAQGTFDIIHPGHLHYLEEAKAMGEELYVIVARRENVTHKQPPVLSNRQRRDVVSALEMVDDARVGHESDIFDPIEVIDPDVIALGFDQHHDPESIQDELSKRDIDCRVQRVSGREPRYEGEILSSREIADQILATRGAEN